MKSAGLNPAQLDADLSKQLRAALHVSVTVHLPDGTTKTVAAPNGRLTTVTVAKSTKDYDAITKVAIALILVVIAALFFLAASMGKRRARNRRVHPTPADPVRR